MKLFKLLRNDARAWWYHADLRKAGKHREAREKEHGSIKSTIERLMYARENNGYASVGRGGYTLHFQPPRVGDGLNYGHCRVEGYGDINSPLIQLAILLGIPVVDTTTCADPLPLIRLPMIAYGHEPADKAPYNSMSYAPLDHVFKLKRELGATTYNWKQV